MAGKQAASVLIGLELDSAAFETSAQRARRVMAETLGGIQANSSRSAQSLAQLTSAAQGMAGIAGFAVGARQALDLAKSIAEAGDQATQLRAKLEASVGNGAQAFQEARTAADSLGVSTDTVAGTVARLGFALQGTGTSREQILQLTETMARLGAVGGASSESISQGLEQLSQGLAKGKLDGDELRSVLENIPGSGRLIAEAMGVSQGALRDLGAEGKITRDVILEAFSDVGGQIKAQFDSLPESMGRATATMQNQISALMAAIDKSFHTSDFFKLLVGGVGDIAAQATGQLEKGGIPRLLFGTPPSEQRAEARRENPGQALQAAQQRLDDTQREIELQQRTPAIGQTGRGGGQLSYIESLQKQAEEARAEINLLTTSLDNLERADHKAASGLRGTKVDEPSQAQLLYPTYGARKADDSTKEGIASYKTFINPLQNDIAQADRSAATAREQAAKSAATLRGEQEKILANAKQEAAAAQMIAEAGGQSTVARQRAVEQAESEHRILEASYKLSKDQLEVFKQSEQARLSGMDRGRTQEAERGQANADIDDYASSLKSRGAEDLRASDQLRSSDAKYNQDVQKAYWEESQGLYDQYLEGMNDKARENQDIMQDILAQPWRNLAGEISGIMGGVFNQILTDAQGLDLSSIATGLEDTMRTAVSGTLGNLVTAPLTQAIEKMRTSSFAEFTADPMAMGGAGIAGGYVASSLANQALGATGKYGGVGSTVGGLAGAGIGFGLGGAPGAAIGGFVGSTAGGLLGGMFGGSDDPNDRSQQQYSSSAGRITYSDKSFGAQNRSITAGILGEVGQLQKALEGLGGTIGDVALNVQSGTKTGLQVNGQRFGDQEAATTFALKQLLASATNLTGSQQTVLANTKGTTAQAIGQDLGFAKTFDDLTFSGREVDRTIRDLNATFDAAKRQAGALGLDVNLLAEANRKAADEVAANYEAQRRAFSVQLETTAPSPGTRSVDTEFAKNNLAFEEMRRQAEALQIPLEQVNQAWVRSNAAIAAAYETQRGNLEVQIRSVGAGNSLGAQLRALEFQMRDLAAQAQALGIPLEEVTAAHARAAAELVKQARRSQRDAGLAYETAITPNELNKTIVGINQQFAGLTDTLVDAGFSANQLRMVERARVREIGVAVEQARRGARDQANDFWATVDPDKLHGAILKSNTAFDQLREKLQDAGYSARNLGLVEQARARSNEEIIKEAQGRARGQQREIEQQTRGLGDYFNDLIEPLRAAANDNRTLNPMTQINQALAKFREDVSGANSGDTRSLQSLGGSAQALRGLVDSNLSTAGMGANIRQEIAESLNNVANDLEQQRNAALATVPEVLRETTADVIKAMREGIVELVAANDTLKVELRRVGRTV